MSEAVCLRTAALASEEGDRFRVHRLAKGLVTVVVVGVITIGTFLAFDFIADEWLAEETGRARCEVRESALL
jgi:hypothetical protein